MATITRSDFANRLRERFGLTTSDALKLVDIVFDEIRESLINGEEVKFAGFGSFKILTKAQRMGRNPKTGEPAVISARRVASFNSCKMLIFCVPPKRARALFSNYAKEEQAIILLYQDYRYYLKQNLRKHFLLSL